MNGLLELIFFFQLLINYGVGLIHVLPHQIHTFNGRGLFIIYLTPIYNSCWLLRSAHFMQVRIRGTPEQQILYRNRASCGLTVFNSLGGEDRMEIEDRPTGYTRHSYLCGWNSQSYFSHDRWWPCYSR